MNKQKSILIGSMAIVLVLFIFLILFIFNKQEAVTTGFNITVVPGNSQIYLDSKKVKSGLVTAKPGKHNLVVKHADFNTYKTIVVSKNNKIISLPIGLKPSTSFGESWKEKNSDEYLKLDGIISQEYAKDSAQMALSYPIINELPQDISPIFRIDYGVSKAHPGDSTKTAIYVSSDSPADKQSALQYVYYLGYDPSDYEIIFEGL